MKNIFYIANIRLPTEKAHGIQIMKTCEALSFAGVDVTLLVPRRFNPIKTDPFEYYKVRRNFLIKKLPTLDLVKLGKIGFFVETAIFSEFAVWYIRFRNKKDKIIYSRDIWPLWNMKFLGWSLFWEAHMGSMSMIVRKTLKGLSGLVAISQGLKKLYEGMGMKTEKIFVSPDAVDLKAFNVKISQIESRKKLGLPVDAKIVMYIGLFDEWKGYKTLLEASRLLPSDKVKTVFIGGTEKQIQELKKEYKDVIFLGCKEYADLPENQKSADVLVIPNSAKYPISRLYTSPLKLFAHMASGVPTVASDLPSLREILGDSEAYFFKADDPQSLADTIQFVFSDPNSQAKSQKAKNKVSEYTWDSRGKNIIDFVNKNV